MNVAAPEIVAVSTPTPICITCRVPARPAIQHVDRHPDAALVLPHAVWPAILDVLQRIACEGARGAATSHPKSAEFMESETGRKGWRAFIQPDTAHLIHVLEEAGLVEFSEIDQA